MVQTRPGSDRPGFRRDPRLRHLRGLPGALAGGLTPGPSGLRGQLHDRSTCTCTPNPGSGPFRARSRSTRSSPSRMVRVRSRTASPESRPESNSRSPAHPASPKTPTPNGGRSGPTPAGRAGRSFPKRFRDQSRARCDGPPIEPLPLQGAAPHVVRPVHPGATWLRCQNTAITVRAKALAGRLPVSPRALAGGIRGNDRPIGPRQTAGTACTNPAPNWALGSLVHGTAAARRPPPRGLSGWGGSSCRRMEDWPPFQLL